MNDKNSDAYKNFINKMKQTTTIPTVTKVCKCLKCGKEFEQTAKPSLWASNKVRKFCSSECAHSRVWTDEKKQALSLKMKELMKENPIGFISPEFKAKEVARKNHSKRELEIVHYFKENFKDDEWKVGCINGSKRYDDIMLVPDLWSKKLKVIIEYDGIWHFKDIHGQLERKHHIDRVTFKYCKENNYRLIRVDEDCKISIQEIVNAVYNDNKQIELFNSNRYQYLFE